MKFKITFISFLSTFLSFAQSNIIINQTSTAPTFDGNGNDAIWNTPTWINMNQIWMPYNNVSPFTNTFESGTKLVNGAADFAGRYKLLWNATNNTLMFLVEIQDDAFITGYTQPGGGYFNYDILEVFLDEDQSGGNHLFDNASENAENAFAYHMVPTEPAVGQFSTSMIGAMDLNGNNYNVVDYQSHFSNFSFKNNGNGSFVYEFELKIYKDTYNSANPAATLKTLAVNDLMGISIAYCDNDDNDQLRDHFFSGTPVDGPNNNNSYINASLFGKYKLGPTVLSTNSESLLNTIKIYPNPITDLLNIDFQDFELNNKAEFKLFDPNGRLILTEKLSKTSTTITTEQLTTGLYWYEITLEEGQVVYGKILK